MIKSSLISGGVQSGPSHCQGPLCGMVDRRVDNGKVWVLMEGMSENGREPCPDFRRGRQQCGYPTGAGTRRGVESRSTPGGP